ncbi:hypothetical protein LJB89_00580 [Tyzzerella sp. OttesenSCG-928-J15]|nr:hypothetical protein [Tyzzerella sp. OttesenSCG-928-J15]
MKFSFLKFILPLGLAISMSIPVFANFSVFDYSLVDTGIEANETIEGEEEAETEAAPEPVTLAPLENHYIRFDGTVTESAAADKRILVESEAAGSIYYNISGETLVYSLNSMEPVNFDKISAGRKVSVFYNVYTPQAMSLPPQVTPEVIVLYDNEETAFVKVDYFDENGLSSDKTLKLNTGEEMLITGTDNRLKTFDDARERNLLVFYSTGTRSMLSQTPPMKIVILNSPVISGNNIQIVEPETTTEEPQPEETLPEGTEENTIQHTKESVLAQLSTEDIITKDETRYVALYKLAEILDYQLEWDSETAIITLRKTGGAESYTIKNDTAEYGYNRAMLHFAKPPFIANSRTYVEETFIDVIVK